MKRHFLKKGMLCLLMGVVCNVMWAQAVIFPQEKQPGKATVSVADGVYTIGNDLFSAKFIHANGDLTFGGCEAMGLMAGGEVFKVQLADGTEIPASEFELADITTETLTGRSDAVKGSRRYHGVQIKAQFAHANGLGIEWRAVLRDGSHYLRTEVDITNNASEGIAMYSITPMMYTVENVDGEKAPAVVGNTRGAVIASDKIFAGLETPMGIQTAGEATDLESFVFKAWNGASSWAWTPAPTDIPQGIKDLTQYVDGTVNASCGYVIFREAGDQTITLDYTSGNNRLQILGVDIVGLNGTVVDGDYHFGFTGGSDSNRDYTVTIPSVGAYMVRIFVTNNGSGEGYSSVGTISYSGKVSQPELVYDLASTDVPYVSPEVAEAPEAEEALPEKVFTLQTGTTYYIAANTKQSNGTITPRYLYINESGALATATEIPVDDTNYRWTLTANGTDAWHVQNGGGKYLSYGERLQAGDAAYSFKFTDETVVDAYGAFALYNPTSSGGKYMVTKVDGTEFDQNGTARNDGQWCSDYLFTTIVTTVGSFDAENTSATDNWVSAWTGFSDWDGALPEETVKTGTAKYKDTGYYNVATGKLDILFDYTGGSHGLYVLGVQVIDTEGNVVAQEFKNGFTGSSSTVTYTVYVPEAGIYKVRYITDHRSGGTDTNGTIIYTFTAMGSITGSTQQTKNWTSAWTGFAVWTDAPEGLKAYDNNNRSETDPVSIQYIDQTYSIKAGKLTVLYDYTGGSHGLHPMGVVLMDTKGNIITADYHAGFTGGSDVNNTYSVRVFEDGFYTVRFVVDKNSGGTYTNGTITLSLTEAVVLGTIDEDTSLSDAWTSTRWTNPDDAVVPNRIVEAGCLAANARLIEQQLTIVSAGELSIEFLYSSGNQRLDIAGVDILDENGDIVASDYHAGFTGNQKDANVYTFTVPQAGVYTLRYFANGTGDSSGNITLRLSVSYTVHLIAAETTPITGMWRRQTTLAAGVKWNVSAVVGLIAPGQARRSFLCYSERERAVPWRAVPAYISWYEVNINHNNAAAGSESENVTEADCLPILEQWKTQLYDKYGEAPYAFVWDDGWDVYGTWEIHSGFPNGFTNMDNVGRAMGAGQGAWLGPVGGYGTSGSYRRNYWNDKGGMQLSNPAYYEVFVTALTNLLHTKGYDFRFFKFDGISTQFSSVGPDAGATGEENAEAIILAERVVRGIKEDVFLNTSVGTWASPFWYQFTDATWRQENDYGTKGSNSVDRENWITYRDFLVYQNYVQNSPLCPINTLMTHGFILTGNPDNPNDTGRGGWTASRNIEYRHVLNELRCAFACGSGMVELYNDYDLMNYIEDEEGNAGALWGDLADCMQWQRKNADVLPDIHWVGGNPATDIYGWAAWNAQKAVLTLRNGLNGEKSYTFTLREALDIPAYVNTTITLTKAFADHQLALTGLAEGEAIDIDAEITVTLPGSSVYVFDGVDGTPQVAIPAIIGAQKIGTFYANETVEIPEGVTAYVATEEPLMDEEDTEGNTKGTIVMTKITDGIIPAETGVVIRGEQGTYTFTGTSTVGTTETEGNLMKGYAGGAQYETVALPTDGTTNYVLAVKNGTTGFYKKEADFKIYNHKAYLQLPAKAQATNALRIRFGNEEQGGTTSIDNLQLTMDNENVVIYDLQGRRVLNPTKGMYIVNGKKVVIK